MSALIAEIVRRSIRHAQRISRERPSEWPTVRRGLMTILADLEKRAPNDPSLSRLRAYIALRDGQSSRNGRSFDIDNPTKLASAPALGAMMHHAVSLDLSLGLQNICISTLHAASSQAPRLGSQAKCRPRSGRTSADGERSLSAASFRLRRSPLSN
jgi:hypothetical protein